MMMIKRRDKTRVKIRKQDKTEKCNRFIKQRCLEARRGKQFLEMEIGNTGIKTNEAGKGSRI